MEQQQLARKIRSHLGLTSEAPIPLNMPQSVSIWEGAKSMCISWKLL